MRNSFLINDSEGLTFANENIGEEQPIPELFQIKKVTVEELAMKLRLGHLGGLKPCSYNPSNNVLKVLVVG